MLPGSENHVKFDLSLEPLSKDSYFAKATNQTHSQTGFSLILQRSQGPNSIAHLKANLQLNLIDLPVL